jgi:hypothetical protein
MSKQVTKVLLLSDDGSGRFVSGVTYRDYGELVAKFKSPRNTLLATSGDNTYRVEFKDGSHELWHKNYDEDSYTKLQQTEFSSMSYKDALEYMTCHPKTPLYDDQGTKYLITCCKLQVNGVTQSDPFCQIRFRNTRFFKTDPKIVFIPFWDAVKAAGQDGKCISKFEQKGAGCCATYRYHSEYPTEWQYWNDGTSMWRNAYGFLNHSIDPHGTTYWAIVEDPSHSN